MPASGADEAPVPGDLVEAGDAVLKGLDLPWDDRCLEFHRTARPVATASSAQVRRPIYSSSVGRWRHYEPYLADLIAALDAPP